MWFLKYCSRRHFINSSDRKENMMVVQALQRLLCKRGVSACQHVGAQGKRKSITLVYMCHNACGHEPARGYDCARRYDGTTNAIASCTREVQQLLH